MTPDVVVDIGNTRLKWGVCRGGHVTDVIRLPLDDATAWDTVLAQLPPPQSFARKWAVASVNPPALLHFVAWSHNHGGSAVFQKYTELPIRVNVDEPEKVGLDRLFGAVAAKALVPPDTPAITVDVGTAVTVNLIDADGVFQGGAIFPGPRLMARALHDFTAKLPLVEPTEIIPLADLGPGKNTAAAIRVGIESALGGGVYSTIGLFLDHCRKPPRLFITGGAHHLIEGHSSPDVESVQVVPTLTLEGIRIAAERAAVSDTAVSLLTAPGTGAIATVQVRGPRAWKLAKQLFTPAGKPLPESPEVHRFWFGTLGSDEVVLAATSTDTIEVHCHGGQRVVRWVIEQLTARGCIETSRTPRPSGEGFDLLQRAPTLRTASILLDQLNGAFANEVRRILALITTDSAAASRSLSQLTLVGSTVGRHLVEPWKVVFAGVPNVGKSSLVNALAGYQRAVVSEVAGTTRDAIGVRVAFDGWPFELIDTAGLRESEGLEAEGVARTREELAGADLTVWVLDGTAPKPVWPEGAFPKSVWFVVNKVDQPLAPWVHSEADDVFGVSTVSGFGMRELIDGLLVETVALFDTLEGANAPFPPGGWTSVPGLPVPFTLLLADLTEAANAALIAGRNEDAARLLREALAACG